MNNDVLKKNKMKIFSFIFGIFAVFIFWTTETPKANACFLDGGCAPCEECNWSGVCVPLAGVVTPLCSDYNGIPYDICEGGDTKRYEQLCSVDFWGSHFCQKKWYTTTFCNGSTPACCQDGTEPYSSAECAATSTSCLATPSPSPSPSPSASPSPSPSPTPGGDWIRFNSGVYRIFNCSTYTESIGSMLNDTSGGSCPSPGKWKNCGNGSPSSGAYDCMVGFTADCSNPSKRCPDEFYAADCEVCVTPTATVTAVCLGFGAACTLDSQCCSTDCDATNKCTGVLTASPTGSVTGSVTSTVTGTGPIGPSTCAGGDACKLGCLPPDPDCGNVGGTNPIIFKSFISTNSWEALMQNVTGWILGVIGSLALLFLIIGGIMYMSAGGDQDRIKTAKSIITAVIIGLIIVVSSYSIISEIKKILGY